MKAKTHCLLSSLVFAAVINTMAKKAHLEVERVYLFALRGHSPSLMGAKAGTSHICQWVLEASLAWLTLVSALRCNYCWLEKKKERNCICPEHRWTFLVLIPLTIQCNYYLHSICIESRN